VPDEGKKAQEKKKEKNSKNLREMMNFVRMQRK
jgi:hypothetical protein